jgi:hypothetical protein
MPETRPTQSPATEESDDWAILECLLDPKAQRPWSIEELIREREDRVAALDAIDRLHRAGLIHRGSDDHVWATRAAARFEEIRW